MVFASFLGCASEMCAFETKICSTLTQWIMVDPGNICLSIKCPGSPHSFWAAGSRAVLSKGELFAVLEVLYICVLPCASNKETQGF